MFTAHRNSRIGRQSYYYFPWCNFGFGTGNYDVYEIQSCPNFAAQITRDYVKKSDIAWQTMISPIKTPARALEKVVRRSFAALLKICIRIYYVHVYLYVHAYANVRVENICTSAM